MALTLQEKLEQITKGLPESPPYVPPKQATPIPDRTTKTLGGPEEQRIEGKAMNAAGSGGSIASPLTETGRTFHDKKIFFSSDGVTYIELQYAKDISFNDANTKPVMQKLLDQA